MDDLKELNNLFKKISNSFNRKLNNKFYWKKEALKAKLSLQERVEKGFGVKDMDVTKKKFKGLEKSTKKRRRRLKKEGKLSKKTKPAKSNQIESGKMVEELKEHGRKDGFSLEISKGRRKIYEAQEKMGRPWLYLDKKEIREITDSVEERIESVLDNIFDD